MDGRAAEAPYGRSWAALADKAPGGTPDAAEAEVPDGTLEGVEVAADASDVQAEAVEAAEGPARCRRARLP